MRLTFFKPVQIPNELLCAVIMLAALFGNLTPMMGRMGNILGLFLAVIVLADCIIERKTRLIHWVLFAGSIVLAVYNTMFVGQHPFQKFIIAGVTFYAVGLYLNLAVTMNYRLWRLVFIIAAAFIMFFWLRSPDGYMLFYQQGRNYVSIFLFVYMMPMILAADRNHITISIGYYVFIVICTISAVGRSGIACALLLLGAVLFYRLLMDEKLTVWQKVRNIVLGLMCAAACGVVLIKYWDRISGKLFSRFVQDNTSSDNARLRILTEYLKTIDSFPKLLLGSNSRSIAYLEQWGGNIHNTYLMTHATYGLIGVTVLVIGIIVCTVLLLKHGYVETGIFLFVFTVRSLIDTVFQAKPGDMIAWFCIIYTFSRLPVRRRVYLTTNRREPENA